MVTSLTKLKGGSREHKCLFRPLVVTQLTQTGRRPPISFRPDVHLRRYVNSYNDIFTCQIQSLFFFCIQGRVLSLQQIGQTWSILMQMRSAGPSCCCCNRPQFLQSAAQLSALNTISFALWMDFSRPAQWIFLLR